MLKAILIDANKCKPIITGLAIVVYQLFAILFINYMVNSYGIVMPLEPGKSYEIRPVWYRQYYVIENQKSSNGTVLVPFNIHVYKKSPNKEEIIQKCQKPNLIFVKGVRYNAIYYLKMQKDITYYINLEGKPNFKGAAQLSLVSACPTSLIYFSLIIALVFFIMVILCVLKVLEKLGIDTVLSDV